MSFRNRLLLTSLVTLAVGLGALVVAGNAVLAARVHAEVSSELRAHADAQLAALSVTGDRVAVREAPNDGAVDHNAWVFAGGRALQRRAGASAPVDPAARALAAEAGAAERDGPGDTRLRAEPVVATDGHRRIGTVVVAQSTEGLEDLQQAVLLGSLVIAALVLLAGGLALRSAIDRALQPVADMTAIADDWGAHDLDRRFDLGPPRDELTGLAATLDDLLGRIAASRRHEQRFAAEVAHELRTPIAGLRGRTELALAAEGPGADAEREAALRSVAAPASACRSRAGWRARAAAT